MRDLRTYCSTQKLNHWPVPHWNDAKPHPAQQVWTRIANYTSPKRTVYCMKYHREEKNSESFPGKTYWLAWFNKKNLKKTNELLLHFDFLLLLLVFIIFKFLMFFFFFLISSLVKPPCNNIALAPILLSYIVIASQTPLTIFISSSVPLPLSLHTVFPSFQPLLFFSSPNPPRFTFQL